MSQYRLTPATQRDLSSIWDFTEDRWDISQAEKSIREIQTVVERVAEDPDRGRVREEIREGYRSYAVGSHVVFHLQRVSHIEVVRILHQRMDFGRHL
ncbi:type II toxin-antitoxin system RelE/ParE family toxin [Nesterenkonia muleiensis]|uniref:type II toxin-antitoxin system RelE/ParE family toxin n=1 Tax=Nesterenkonia muleiensis TaxID=2282648 RepID=UPI000E7589C3|nr:type II toxin-antitoxin system RelE/ParE family toxin [Nesterenkonia muleiensis]